ncbi:glycosyltransferase family 2 protein [Granulosicoccaceae sp. 1_MG-2023]|nr:glycosyltransferase family 2 protein [Granulosicoccaceae sp. 1_MG-2023]
MPRIVMTLLVRDEADIIADTIRYHAARGVDAFAVMDNGSQDGTREILDALADTVELRLIDQPQDTYRQADWMTQLARLARRQLGADFIISNDADEFWVPDAGLQYRDLLRDDDVQIRVPRHNAVFTEAIRQPDYDYLNAPALVRNPVQFSREQQLSGAPLCMQLVPTGPKVMVRARGLRRIRGGNHGAAHWRLRPRKRTTGQLRIVHFPIRSLARWRANVQHRAALLQKGAAMGPHYRRWADCLENGTLEAEIERMILPSPQIGPLIRLGILDPARDCFADLRAVLRTPA